jgi:hypothetical protein
MFKLGLTVSIFLLLISAPLIAQSPFRSDDEAFRFGYEEGYQHGVADSEKGLEFNYAHSHRFQSGISYNSYVDSNFRSGYIDGYKDGYDLRHDDMDDYDDDGDLQLSGTTSGFVTVFTNRQLDGTSRAFSVGQYPYLNGKLNKTIHSVEVHGPVRVILFDEPNFRGRRMILEENTFDLDDFNFGDRAESMIIERLN